MSGKSLQRRLILRVCAVVGGLWLAAAALTWMSATHEMGELLDAHLAQSAALLVAQNAHIGDGDEDDRLLDAPQLRQYSRHVAYQVWHAGELQLRSPNAPLEPLSDRQDGFETRLVDGENWRLFSTHGVERDLQVHVGESMSARRELLWAMWGNLLLPMVLALPLLALAAWAAVHRGLLPLRELSELLASRQPQQADPLQLHQEPPTELRPMVTALNQLFGRIAELMAAERRFTADAAHELRTPIAALRAQAQVALGATDDAERRHALESTVSACDRASHLVQQLLTLSRLESGESAALQPLDLGAVARRVAADLAPAALARRQSLSLDAARPAVVRGSDVLLSALLRNLIDNAIRYSPPGAVIRLQVLAREDASVEAVVEDSGPGMSSEHLARLGQRFFRVLGQDAEGSGLGWSIVTRIAQAHGAQLQASVSPELGGLRVQVSWPAP
jgi:two-component system sensor histidine kinase QseC